MTRLLSTSVLAVILLAAVTTPAAAGNERPLRGTFRGSAVDVEQRCPGALTVGFAIEGVVAHLGRVTGVGSNCTGFDLVTSAVPILAGVVTLRAADGSTLTISYQGTQDAPVGGVGRVSHADTIRAGTGRLTGAAGEFTLDGYIDFSDLTVRGSISGWIEY